jgi:phosphoribosylformimino-5-aminoimidazole carboxamide ribotide isomerase
MLIIPAIDLKNGKCVRLVQGRMQAATVYADDPATVARRWADAGAELLHVVDLDGAVSGKPRNTEVVTRILESIRIPVQMGGGVRDSQTVQAYLEQGVSRVIIGTEAIRNPAWVREVCRAHPGRIAVGIDARDGRVATHGWTRTTDIEVVDLARGLQDCGIAAIIFTDIHRDGMQTGPNIEATRRVAEAIRIPVIASGGVGSLEHIRDLLPLEEAGVIGVITGKALYSGAIQFAEALALTRQSGRMSNPIFEKLGQRA